MNTNLMIIKAGLAAGLMAKADNQRQRRIEHLGGSARESHAWDNVQLSKAERRGKSFEEMQALRRQKWEAANGKYN